MDSATIDATVAAMSHDRTARSYVSRPVHEARVRPSAMNVLFPFAVARTPSPGDTVSKTKRSLSTGSAARKRSVSLGIDPSYFRTL
jgi:hypothetical protein